MATSRPALALFDLDHTLIPFDSGMAWTRFLIRTGALDAAAEARYLGWAHAYVAGTLDMRAMHRSTIAPLAEVEPARLRGWLDEFEAEVAPRLPAAAHELVARHRDGGALCAIVTATSRLIAAPFARAFGIEHLLATETRFVDGRPDGEIDGEPCYREHKTAHVRAWLAERGTALDAFEPSWFYSDSAGDLALLGAVTHPVAVAPDERLRAHARSAGWDILELHAAT